MSRGLTRSADSRDSVLASGSEIVVRDAVHPEPQSIAARQASVS